MSPKTLPPPILIEDVAGLEALLRDLEGQSHIAIDTEADAFFSYHQKVCLVQVTVEDRDYLIDPLAVDLGPLGPVLADPERVKIFHDGEFDVLLLKRQHGFEFASLFDTRVAAAVLGSTTPGLASVLEQRFGVKLDKSMQRSDWSKRPLTPKQVDYARLDTHYLLPLAAEQREELVTRDRLMIVESECRRLEALVPPDVETDPDDYVRLKGVRDLDPRGRAIVRELYRMREDLARDWDVPPFRVLNNPVLLDIARVRPKDAGRLRGIPGCTARVVGKIGDRILDAVERGQEAPPVKRLPQKPKRDGTEDLDELGVELHERFKKWRKEVAEAIGMESAYLLNRHVLRRLVEDRPRDLDALERVEGIQDWQVERHGKDLVEVVKRFEADEQAGRIPTKRRWRGR